MARMTENPVAANGAPMGMTMCECGHMYVEHVEEMPSPPEERACRECGCAKFVTATDEQVAQFDEPERERVVREYGRLGALHLLWD